MNEFSLITQNPILSMHQDVHSKATYPLRVHQFTTQQVSEGGKRRNNFSLITQKFNHEYAQTHSFKGNLPANSVPVHNTASGQRRERRNKFSLSTQNPIMSMYKYVHSKAT